MLLPICKSDTLICICVAVFTLVRTCVVLTYILTYDATAELALTFILIVSFFDGI